MFPQAALPPDLLTLLAALFLLLGVPAILFGLVMLYTGYVRYDAEQYLEELEAAEGADSPPPASERGPADDETADRPDEPDGSDQSTRSRFE